MTPTKLGLLHPSFLIVALNTLGGKLSTIIAERGVQLSNYMVKIVPKILEEFAQFEVFYNYETVFLFPHELHVIQSYCITELISSNFYVYSLIMVKFDFLLVFLRSHWPGLGRCRYLAFYMAWEAILD